MLACTFVHRKFVGRTPTGKAMLRAFLGGAKNEALLDESDEVLVATVRRELSEILGARGGTAHSGGGDAGFALAASDGAVCGGTPGADEARERARVAELPGLRLAGNAYDGIGIPDCIRMGRKAAKELMAEKLVAASSR